MYCVLSHNKNYSTPEASRDTRDRSNAEVRTVGDTTNYRCGTPKRDDKGNGSYDGVPKHVRGGKEFRDDFTVAERVPKRLGTDGLCGDEIGGDGRGQSDLWVGRQECIV